MDTKFCVSVSEDVGGSMLWRCVSVTFTAARVVLVSHGWSSAAAEEALLALQNDRDAWLLVNERTQIS